MNKDMSQTTYNRIYDRIVKSKSVPELIQIVEESVIIADKYKVSAYHLDLLDKAGRSKLSELQKR